MADVGRPLAIDKTVLSKLEEAFLIGATDKEACLVANISMATLYRYCEENPEFRDRKEELKDTPKYAARKNVIKALGEGDKNMSQWYLERKAKEEFSQRTESTGKDGKDLIPETTDEIKKIAEQINDIHRNRKTGQ